MKKRADELVAGDRILFNGVERKVVKTEVLTTEVGVPRGVMITFESLIDNATVVTWPLYDELEIVEQPSEAYKEGLYDGWSQHIEDLKEEGFEPGRWWRAYKDGQMLAETSNPSDFKALDLMDDPAVTFRHIYVRTENTWVMERPDA